jgi:hypothetical protein
MKLSMKFAVVPFLAGLLAGSLLGRYASPWYFYRRAPAVNQEERFLKRFSSDLALSSQQKEEISAILKARRAETEKLLAEYRPKFEAVRTSTQDDIRKVLTPEQQKKFDKLLEKRHRGWKRGEPLFKRW